MEIIKIVDTIYDLEKYDYIVFCINTDRSDPEIDFSKCSDKEFIMESMDQQYFYSLRDFQECFNNDELISTFTDYIRILPSKYVLQLIMVNN